MGGRELQGRFVCVSLVLTQKRVLLVEIEAR